MGVAGAKVLVSGVKLSLAQRVKSTPVGDLKVLGWTGVISCDVISSSEVLNWVMYLGYGTEVSFPSVYSLKLM